MNCLNFTNFDPLSLVLKALIKMQDYFFVLLNLVFIMLHFQVFQTSNLIICRDSLTIQRRKCYITSKITNDCIKLVVFELCSYVLLFFEYLPF